MHGQKNMKQGHKGILIKTVVMKKGHSSQGSVVIEIVAETVFKGIGGIVIKGRGHMVEKEQLA